MARKRIIDIYVTDFETTSENQFKLEGKTRVYLWQSKSLDGKESELGLTIKEYVDYLSSLQKDKIVYFHNLSFDGSFILWYLLENNYEYKEQVLYEREPKTFETLIDDGNIYYAIKMIHNDNTFTEFRCSYKLLPYSLKKIGQIVGVDKLDETHDYNEIKNFGYLYEVPQEEIDYIENDTEILRLAIIKLRELGIKDVTISTSAYKSWRMKRYLFSRNHLIKPSSEEINQIVDKSYRGGLTKINERYRDIEIEDVISLDVNSLYPYIMVSNSFPTGEGKMFNSVEDAINENYQKRIIVVYIKYVKVKEGYHSFIGQFKGFSYGSYKYEDELENTYLYLWEEEYNLFKLVYEGDTYIQKVVGFKKYEYVFNEYIEEWHNRKETATTETEKELAKLMLNSLYGKFGMNDVRSSKIPLTIENDKIIYELKESETIYYYRPIASYITSQARVKLATAIQLLADRFIYCDTDSIYLKGSEIPTDILDVGEHKIGQWKYEGHYKRFKGLKAKCYLVEKDNGKLDSSIAGLPLNARSQITFDNFEFGLKLQGVKKSKVNVTGGTIIKDIDFSINPI